MTFIDNNTKLADLIEKLLDGKASNVDTKDANDLVIDLRSKQSDIYLCKS